MFFSDQFDTSESNIIKENIIKFLKILIKIFIY